MTLTGWAAAGRGLRHRRPTLQHRGQLCALQLLESFRTRTGCPLLPSCGRSGRALAPKSQPLGSGVFARLGSSERHFGLRRRRRSRLHDGRVAGPRQSRGDRAHPSGPSRDPRGSAPLGCQRLAPFPPRGAPGGLRLLWQPHVGSCAGCREGYALPPQVDWEESVPCLCLSDSPERMGTHTWGWKTVDTEDVLRRSWRRGCGSKWGVLFPPLYTWFTWGQRYGASFLSSAIPREDGTFNEGGGEASIVFLLLLPSPLFLIVSCTYTMKCDHIYPTFFSSNFSQIPHTHFMLPMLSFYFFFLITH